MSVIGKITRRIRMYFYSALWEAGSRGYKAAKKENEALAGQFLKEKGLIKEPGETGLLADKWAGYVKTLFDPSRPEEFYLNWKDSAGAANISANIRDQFSRKYFLYALKKELGKWFKGRILDFGCGTAAASASYLMAYSAEAKLDLADVDNLASEFVSYLIVKHRKFNISKAEISLRGVKESFYDAVACIHVLEHLKNPSEVFMNLADKLKPGGILFIEAPWGGHPEHLPEAPLDWEKNKGAAYLEENFIKKSDLNPFCTLSGIYIKKLKKAAY